MMRLVGGVWKQLMQPQRYHFSLLTDYFTKKQMKKQEGEFKKQMQYLANKPVFTLMDYKQRIQDELQKIKGQLRAKFNQDAQETEKQLQMQKKVLSGLFEEELNMQKSLKFIEKTQISLVTQLPIEFVTKTIKKFDEYKSMHKLLRQMRLNNQPLPQTQQEFQQLFLSSSVSRENPKFKYNKYKYSNKIMHRRQLKKSHDHGYFFN